MPGPLTIQSYPSLITGLGYSATAIEPWNIKITKSAMGGFNTLDFHLRGDEPIDVWLEDGLGRHIEVYNDGLVLIWEGFVNEIEINIGTLTLTHGPYLDIGNKVKVAFSTIEWTDGEPNYGVRHFTDWAGDADSQAKYGILEKVVSTAGASEVRAEQIRDVALEEIREPETAETENLESSSIPSFTIHCLGYYHYLETFTYSSTTTGTENASTKLQNVLAAEPNGIFSTDYSRITSNTTQVGAYEQSFRTAITFVKGIIALGDSSLNRWIFRLAPGRVPVYEAIPTSILYQRRLYDPRQVIAYYNGGGEIQPWNIEPAQWVFYPDFLIARGDPTDFPSDPRCLFIEEMTYREPHGLTLQGSRITNLKQLLNRFGVGGFHA